MNPMTTPPLPWENAEMERAEAECIALVDRARWHGTGYDREGRKIQRDTVQALVWLHQCVADAEVKADAMGVMQGRLTEGEWPPWLIWRQGTARYLVPAMQTKTRRYDLSGYTQNERNAA